MHRLILLRLRIRRAILARRRLLAAIFAALAVWITIRASTAPPPPTVQVVVAARDLPAGTRVTTTALTTASYPPAAVPAGVLARPGEVVGRTLAAPIRRGEPLTDVRLLSQRTGTAYPGREIVPLRLPDPAVAALLRTGDRVDLRVTDPQAGTTRTVTQGAVVVAVPRADQTGGGPGLGGRLVVLAIDPADVDAVIGASVTGFVTVALAR